MLKMRDHYLKRESTLANADTTIIDLNIVDPISALVVEIEATNGATSCNDHEIHDDVSKIEVVDGSDVLFSCTMIEAIANHYYHTGQMPHRVLSEVGGAKQEESVTLHFGRFVGDQELWLDPTKHRNLQLRLTHAFEISATVGFATGTGKLTVTAKIIEEGALPNRGFLMTKNKYSFTSATSGDEVIDLPRDYPYRMLMVKSLKTLLRPDEVISKWKLSVDADKYIPFENYTEDIMDACESRLGLARMAKNVLRADDASALLDLYDIRDAHANPRADDHIVQVEALDAEKVTLGLYIFTGAPSLELQATAKNNLVRAEGLAPFACLAHWFGALNAEDTWFNAPSYGDVKLYLTQAAAGACSVVLQQHRR